VNISELLVQISKTSLTLLDGHWVWESIQLLQKQSSKNF